MVCHTQVTEHIVNNKGNIVLQSARVKVRSCKSTNKYFINNATDLYRRVAVSLASPVQLLLQGPQVSTRRCSTVHIGCDRSVLRTAIASLMLWSLIAFGLNPKYCQIGAFAFVFDTKSSAIILTLSLCSVCRPNMYR